VTGPATGRRPRRHPASLATRSRKKKRFFCWTPPCRARTPDLPSAWSCVATGPCRYQLQKFEVRGGPPEPAFETVAKSTRGVVTIEANGKVLIQPETFMKTMPSTVELLRMAIVRYPTEPIGVGATWTEQESDLRRVYKVAKLDDKTIELDVTFTYESETGVSVPGTSKLAARLGDPLAQTMTSTQQQTFPMNGTPVETRTELTPAPPPRGWWRLCPHPVEQPGYDHQ